jgi:hypothetical protein
MGSICFPFILDAKRICEKFVLELASSETLPRWLSGFDRCRMLCPLVVHSLFPSRGVAGKKNMDCEG